MEWNDFSLWAALILFIEIFCHFLRQRTLRDKNSRIFTEIIVLGILHCFLGISLIRVLTFQYDTGDRFILGIAFLLYLVNTALPFKMLRFIVSLCNFQEKKEKRITMAGRSVWLCSVFMIMLNFPFKFLFYVENGILQSGPLYIFYSAFFMLYSLFDLYFILKCGKALGKEASRALIEANLIAIIGLMFQQYFHLHMVFGFTLSIAVLVLYLLLKNPHAYMDEETNVFNANYFYTYMKDRKIGGKDSLLIVDFYNLISVSYIYTSHTEQKLVVKIAEQLWKMKGDSQVFRVAPDRFVLCVHNDHEMSELKAVIHRWLYQGILVDKNYVTCRAILAEIQMEHIRDVKELKAYTDFLIDYALAREDMTEIHDSDELKKQFDYETEIEHFLPEAIEKDLFQVWYQPVYSLDSKKYVSMEALSRLKHPKLGWISPELFIQIAVRNGWATKITQLQLKKVCDFIKNNEEILKDIQNIKINLSPCELLENGYCEKLLSAIHGSSVPFSKIQFEVTETTATQYTKETHRFINMLQKEGVGLCLDDFGAGYANLNSVLSLPYSTVKMDRSLLQGICENGKSSLFYRDLVTILKRQGFMVVAEGVEKEQEVELLSEWKVDFIQGFYFSKPVPEQEILLLLVPRI